MKFALSTEQVDLGQMLGTYLAERSPLASTVNAASHDLGFDRAAWEAMARGLGMQGVDVPDELGGTGMTTVELSVVFQHAGRELYSGPLLTSSGLALSLLLASTSHGTEAERLTAGAVDGRVLVAAVADDGGPWRAEAVRTSARESNGSWQLTGVKHMVLQANLADHLLVAARRPDDTLALFAVDPTDAHLHVEDSIDPTRPVCRLELADVPAALVLDVTPDLLAVARQRANLAIASESLGAAQRALEITSAHARHRTQFGQPIGAFQGVKHRLADVLVEIELATSAVYLAACHLAEKDFDAARASVPMARIAADNALATAASASVQVHGGIGFTWENESHLFVKRARANRELLGGPSERLAELWQHGRALVRAS